MRPRGPYSRPLDITPVEGEVVFLGEGPISFSMTPAAARMTLHNLATALQGLRPELAVERNAAVVLVVEDEPLVRELAATLLEDAGYVVIVAEGPRAALLALESAAKVHLLFTDIQMPGEIDGVELARLVRDRWPGIGVLVTSGMPTPPTTPLPTGGRLLAKPYRAEDVLRHVDELTTA